MGYISPYDYSLLEEAIIIKDEEFSDTSFNGGEAKSIVVDAGCGNGHFLIEKAPLFPDTLFFGIEKKKDRVVRCREKEIKHTIKNIRWIVGDISAALKGYFPDGMIDELSLLFPDPWPKRKHHKKRLISPRFLDILVSKLKKGGDFYFVTDFIPYYEYALEIVKEDPRFELHNPIETEEYEGTLFGMRWKKEEREIAGFHLIKK